MKNIIRVAAVTTMMMVGAFAMASDVETKSERLDHILSLQIERSVEVEQVVENKRKPSTFRINTIKENFEEIRNNPKLERLPSFSISI